MLTVCLRHACRYEPVSTINRVVKQPNSKPYVVQRTLYKCCKGCRYTVIEYR